MTYKIFLLRHAKSSWDNQNLTDFERPLNQRGVNNATALGEYLKSINFKVDQILSSPSERTLQTLQILSAVAKIKNEIITVNSMYHSTLENLLTIIRQMCLENRSLLLVGHNPSMHEVYEYLTSDSITNFPTCGFAEVSFTEDLSKSLEGVAKCDLFVKYHPPSILKEVLICSVCLRRTKDEEISGQGLLRLIFHDKAE